MNPSQNEWDLPYINTWDNLEVMTWNIENFPKSSNTISDVQEIISDLMPDIISIQEIDNLNAYQNLQNQLQAYEFLNTNDVWGNLGIA